MNKNLSKKITVIAVSVISVVFLIISIVLWLVFVRSKELSFLVYALIFSLTEVYNLVMLIKTLFDTDIEPDSKDRNYTYLVSQDINQNVVIDIEQTKQNFGIEYECKKNNNILFKGKDTFIEGHLPALMTDVSGSLIFKYQMNFSEFFKSQIPTGAHTSRSGTILNSNGIELGNIVQVGSDKDRYYTINYDNDFLEIFMWSTGADSHLSVFLNKKQIAQIEHDNIVKNNLDKYHLYLLKDYEKYTSILCFFAIIYDKYEHGHHGQAHYGTKTDVSFEYSFDGIGYSRYFKDFMKMNFPNTEIIDKEFSIDNLKNDFKAAFKTAKKETFTKKAYFKSLRVGIPFCICINIFLGLISWLVFNSLMIGILFALVSALIEYVFFRIVK